MTREELKKKVRELERELGTYKSLLEKGRSKEERAQEYLDIAGVMIVAMDIDQRVTLINRKGCEILKYEEQDIVGKNWFDHFVPENFREEARKVFLLLMAEEVHLAEWFENPVLTGDGSERSISWHNNVLRDEKGRIAGTLSSGEDISMRKDAQKALQRERDLLNQIVTMSPAGITVVDRDGKITFANESAERVLGLKKDEITQRSYNAPEWRITDYEGKPFPDEDLPFRKVMATGEPVFDVRHAIEWPDGRSILLSVNAAPLSDGSGSPDGMVATVENVTDRILAGVVLEREKEKFRVLVEESPLGVALISRDGEYKYVNPKFTEIFGYTQKDIHTGREWFRKVYPDREYRSQIISTWDKDQRESKLRQATPRVFTVRCKDGSEKVIQFRAVAMATGDHFMTYEDITEKKILEAQLLHAQKMEAIGTIASGVAHNFRNILTVISMKSQLLEMKYSRYPALQEISEGIRTYVDRGVHLVEGLMQFCRREPRREFQRLNLCAMIWETYQLISKSFDKMIEIAVDVPETLVITGDSSGLSQVLMNLCTNARDAMPQGGVLRLEARDEQGKAVVIVSDTGQGMDPKTVEKCFDPFFTTKETGKGTGLGLSTAYGIVKEHGGEIRVESKSGAGTRFILSFALAEGEKEEMQEEEEGVVRGRGQKVLIVDDEMEICRVMEEMLETFGYEPAHATSGREGIEKFMEIRPDVLLLDRNLPGMDGMRCFEEIMRLDPQAKVIIMSGYDDSGMEEEKRKLIKGYITKPVDIHHVLSLLANVLQPEH